MFETNHSATGRLFYKGDQVRVRPLEDIIATLDEKGTLGSLPFMPEMKQFCGREFTVSCRLEKTCVEGAGVRLLPDTVLLEGLRCEGTAHGDCQRSCSLLWKEAWLEPVGSGINHPPMQRPPSGPGSGFKLMTMTDEGLYFCQSTALHKATRYLFPLSFKRCTAEYFAKNIGLQRSAQFLWVPLLVGLKSRLLGRAAVQPVGPFKRTPTETLNLQPGEWVEVKTPAEIGATLDTAGFNRGLEFTPQMLPFCGGTFRVRGRVDCAILETTGKMRKFKNTVLLENATCDGHTILGGCSRDVYHYWREIWLRRSNPPIQ